MQTIDVRLTRRKERKQFKRFFAAEPLLRFLRFRLQRRFYRYGNRISVLVCRCTGMPVYCTGIRVIQTIQYTGIVYRYTGFVYQYAGKPSSVLGCVEAVLLIKYHFAAFVKLYKLTCVFFFLKFCKIGWKCGKYRYEKSRTAVPVFEIPVYRQGKIPVDPS